MAEKETRLAEGMLIMGMNEACRQAMWMVVYGLQHTVVALLVTIGLCNPTGAFGRSDFTLIFVLFALYGLGVTAFGNFIALFFERAKTAAVIGTFIFIIGLGPFMTVLIIGQVKVPEWGQVLSCLMVPSALGLGISQVASYQASGNGLTWANMFVLVNNMRFAHTLYMLVVDIVLLLLLAWWVDKWNPLRTIGTKHPPWFCVLPQYWCPRSAAASACRKKCDRGVDGDEHSGDGEVAPSELVEDISAAENAATGGRAGKNHFEEYTVDQKYKLANGDCIKVRNLVKRFRTPDGIKTAVNNLDMTLFDGEIFVLLGHNGAGKTTTISMLSGLLRPSSGQADILGMNVWTQMGSIRQQMGVCPQQNVLFEDITVEEHLYMFGRLKGVNWKALPEQVRMRLRDVGMRSKAKAFAGQLSGGQKRKLCLAIALMGDSKVLFLDEPTSGMDVFAQRSVWALLRKVRKNRIIVLTTHSMEEADMLGDRIGIMAEGKMVCCGTPIFLKALYGVGYSLVITTLATESAHAFVESIVLRHVPAATQHSGAAKAMSKEISFQLPFSAAQSFEAMFTEFDAIVEDESDERLEAYGISVTTMEEVFLKSAHDASESLDRSIADREPTDADVPDIPAAGDVAFSDAATEDVTRGNSTDDTTGGAAGGANGGATGGAEAEGESGGMLSAVVSPASLTGSASSDPIIAAESDGTTRVPPSPGLLVAPADAAKSGSSRRVVSDDGGRAMMEEKLAHIKELQKFGFCRQLCALLLRRIAYARRDLKLALFQFAIPLIVLVFGLALLIIVAFEVPQPPRDYYNEALEFNGVGGIPSNERVAQVPYVPGAYLTPLVASMEAPPVVGVAIPFAPLDIQTVEKAQNWPNARQTPAQWTSACKTILPSYYRINPFDLTGRVLTNTARDVCVTAQYLLQTHDKTPSGGGKGGTTYLALVQNVSQASYTVLANMSNCEYCPGIGIQLANTALYRQRSGTSGTIRMTLHPMPQTKNALASNQQVTGILFAIVLLLGWAFIPAAFVEFIVRERQLGVKHQLLISGTSIFAYWLSNLIFDLLLSAISLVLIATIIITFSWSGNIELFKEFETLSAFLLLMGAYFIVCPPMMCVVPYLSSLHSLPRSDAVHTSHRGAVAYRPSPPPLHRHCAALQQRAGTLHRGSSNRRRARST